MEPSVLMQGFQSSSPFLWVSEAYLLTGAVGEASQFARRALDHAREHDERGHQAWALWLLGEIAAYRTPPEEDVSEVLVCYALRVYESPSTLHPNRVTS